MKHPRSASCRARLAATTCPPDCQLRLASQRTATASERTFAAWIRTGLAALAFGIAIHRLASGVPSWPWRLAATGLITLGASCFAVGLRRLQAFAGTPQGDPIPPKHLLRLLSWTFLGGSVAAIALIWAA